MSEFRIGAEFEFAAVYTKEALADILHGVGIQIQPSQKLPDGTKDYTRWFFVHDGSIRPPHGFQPYELVSPIMPLVDGLGKIKKVFEFLNNTGSVTNESTGFHVSLSFSDVALMKRIRTLKLVMLLNETKVLSDFNRAANKYCQSHRSYLKRAIVDYTNRAIVGGSWNSLLESESNISRLLKMDKYHTVNLTKLSRNYLEFRAMGGEDYHKRFDDIKAMVSHYIECMEASISPTLKEDEFNQILKGYIEISDRSALKIANQLVSKRQKDVEQAQSQVTNLESQLKIVDQYLQQLAEQPSLLEIASDPTSTVETKKSRMAMVLDNAIAQLQPDESEWLVDDRR